MVQVGKEAGNVAKRVKNPACGARAASPLFAAFARFRLSELKKIQTSRMVPLLTCVLL